MRRLCPMLLTIICLVLPSCAAPFKCYRTSVGSGADEIPVVVVGGTPYAMGRAIGELMPDEVEQCMAAWLGAARKADSKRYTDAELDAAWKAVSPYAHERFRAEMKGLADGSGVSYDLIRRVHMIPVVSDFACSGVVAWGRATRDGHRLHIRNLDFSTDAGLQDCPAIIVYVPDKGIPHANVTVAGYIGSHTGMNAEGVVVGEKGESPKTEYPFDLDGTHFSTILRDVLYDARDFKQAVDRITSAKLIKRYYLYVSGGKGTAQGGAKIKVTSPDATRLTVWRDDDKTDELAPKILDDAVYNTMNNDLAYERLKADYGKLGPLEMIALSRALASKNGSLTNVVYDGTTLEMWVAFAEKDQPASARSYVHVKVPDYLDPSKIPADAVVLSDR